jgi:cytidylate kinase
MIVTIDGPAGAGKSTIAKMLADRLGFQFLDTGAMYRAVTWAALKRRVDLNDQRSVAAIAAKTEIRFVKNRVIVNGHDVTSEIRTPYVTAHVSEIADNPDVREHMVMLQREIASSGNFVCEGRDQGTVAFPNAECKIYLTATSAERARRRYEQLVAAGQDVQLGDVLEKQIQRDWRDKSRPVGRLEKAHDAVEFATDGMSPDEVADALEEITRPLIKA